MFWLECTRNEILDNIATSTCTFLFIQTKQHNIVRSCLFNYVIIMADIQPCEHLKANSRGWKTAEGVNRADCTCTVAGCAITHKYLLHSIVNLCCDLGHMGLYTFLANIQLRQVTLVGDSNTQKAQDLILHAAKLQSIATYILHGTKY